MRATYQISLHLPFIAIVIIVSSSFFSLFQGAMIGNEEGSLGSQLPPGQLTHAIFIDVVAIIVATLLFDVCRRIVDFEKATGKIINQFGRAVQKERHGDVDGDEADGER